MQIYKYLIECLDGSTVKTFALEGERFELLRLHGGESFLLNGSNHADYWRLWKNETGHTAEDSTDICVVRGDKCNMEDFFRAGKELKTVSPTTWTSEELERFFSFTGNPLKTKLNTSLNGTIRVTAANSQKLLIGTLGKPYLPQVKAKPSRTVQIKTSEPPPVKVSAPKKNSATAEEVLRAFAEMSNNHRTKRSD